MKNIALFIAEQRSVHGHCATVLIVVGRSAMVHGQPATVRIVAGHSATLGTVAKRIHCDFTTMYACFFNHSAHLSVFK